MDRTPPPPSFDILLAARALQLEDMSVRILERLGAAGVDALLLKGASTDRWLYAPAGLTRSAGDVDVLVAPGRYAAAEAVLRSLGFVNRYDGASPAWAEEHADSWVSQAWPLPVDLHRRLWGFAADPARVWAALWASREVLELGHGSVLVPGEAERLLVTVLHAAHHGTADKTLEDLRRAIERVDEATASRAAGLAAELSAEPGLVAGLGLVEGGASLRDRLGLRGIDGEMPAVRPRMWDVPATAEGFLRVSQAPGIAPKLRLLWRELVPSAAFMRLRSAEARLARRGLLGLLSAYGVRWWRLLRTGGAGARAALRLRG